jgi:copper ion binding protein
MQKEFQVKGMTCQGCRAHVEEALQNIKGVKTVNVNLENKTAEVEFHQDVSLEILQEAVGEKYDISEKKETSQGHEAENGKNSSETALMQNEDSKLKQLKPLFLIFLYITSASLLINWSDFSLEQWMYDFMGMFFIVFSFFKFLDYKGFPASFKMYDPLAKVVPAYAWAYPFLETLLGLCFLFRFQIDFALIATLIVLGITTIGVSQSLFSKRKIKCACLGTALNLPMTEATFIENTIMIIMAIIMLIY